MIIRAYETSDLSSVKDSIEAPEGMDGAFGRIDLLAFTSTELRERFGLSFADADVRTPSELMHALSHQGERPTDAQLQEERVAHLAERRSDLLPAFVAYQETSEGLLLPLMTDGPDSRWSLFFTKDGRMTLAQFGDGQWTITRNRDLLPEMPERFDAIGQTRSFLLNGLRSAKKMMGRAEEKPGQKHREIG